MIASTKLSDEENSEVQTSRYDVVLANVTWSDLWLSARKIYKIKPVKILAWIGKELLRPPPTPSKGAIDTDGCWGEVTLREKRPLVGCSCHSERPKSCTHGQYYVDGGGGDEDEDDDNLHATTMTWNWEVTSWGVPEKLKGGGGEWI